MRVMRTFLIVGFLAGGLFSAFARSSEVALLQGGEQPDGSYLIGLHIKLAPGWMTYWRDPGEAGIAPKVDFSGSENLAGVSVDFPAPKPFDEGGLKVFGYDKEVVFPLHLTPKDAGKPVLLRLKFDYGVCEKMCVPESASFEQALERQPVQGHFDLVERWRKLVPPRDKKVSIDLQGE